ncbi:MAG: rhodanese-like domain-containing protein [Motiliproteus sp.]|nr:rhodanese-like domain-containing protein [Motiliproteus sp.]
MKALSTALLILTIGFSSWLQAGEQEAKAWQMIGDGALVIDVRTTEEYAEGHIRDALHIPFQQILGQFQSLEIRKDRPVVLYCRSGRRASVAEAELAKAGFTQIFNGGGLIPMVEHLRNQPAQ